MPKNHRLFQVVNNQQYKIKKKYNFARFGKYARLQNFEFGFNSNPFDGVAFFLQNFDDFVPKITLDDDFSILGRAAHAAFGF